MFEENEPRHRATTKDLVEAFFAGEILREVKGAKGEGRTWEQEQGGSFVSYRKDQVAPPPPICRGRRCRRSIPVEED